MSFHGMNVSASQDQTNRMQAAARMACVVSSTTNDPGRSPKTKMPSSKYKRFDVYWWVASDGPELCRYATRKPTDIQQFSVTHFRIVVHPFDAEDDDIELILRQLNGLWTFKSDTFADASEDYPIVFASTDRGAVWTDAHDDEMMVIQATF